MTDQIEEHELEDDTNDDGFDVEIVDDTPPEDAKFRSSRKAKADDNDDDGNDDAGGADDDDLSQYSKSVQKRIQKLRYDTHEERRAKEEAVRLSEAAISEAQRIRNENEALRRQLEQGQVYTIDQAKARYAAEVDRAKVAYKEAYEAGDAEALVAAQETLNKAQNQLMRAESFRPRPIPQQPQQPQMRQQPQQQVPQLDEKQRAWLAKNDSWFGVDEGMTGYAYGIHEKLVKSGVDPNSETYYAEVDKAMRATFPHRFEDSQRDDDAEDDRPEAHVDTVVAPAKRSGKRPRRIKISASQAALAKRLGLTPEQYAAELMKEAGNG